MVLASAGDPIGVSQEFAPRPTHRQLNKRFSFLCVAISPDGQTLAFSAEDKGVKLMDLVSRKEGLTLLPPGNRPLVVLRLAFNPDGKTIAVGCCPPKNGSEVLVKLFDVATGKEKFALDTGWSSKDSLVVFAPDGKTLAVAGKEVVLWDLESRKVRARLSGHSPLAWAVAFSPNGKVLATSRDFGAEIFLWDAATGRKCFTFKPKEKDYCKDWKLAFSPDGQILAAGDGMGVLVFLDPQTGEVKATLRKYDQKGIGSLAFSPDGRMLVVAAKDTIELWEVSTTKKRTTLRGQEHKDIISIAISPNGRTLAAGSALHNILQLWDLADIERKQAPDVTETASLWTALVSEDADLAYRAIRTLSAFPTHTLPLLRKQLRPLLLTEDDSRKIDRLLADLDGNDFAIREKASKEPKAFGLRAEPALRRVLAGSPSPEVRRRVAALLADIERQKAVQPIQQLRALEVLEHIGTAEARALLSDLAKGVPEARLTQEAKASLARLAKRPVPKP